MHPAPPAAKKYFEVSAKPECPAAARPPADEEGAVVELARLDEDLVADDEPPQGHRQGRRPLHFGPPPGASSHS
jgi:hypothetical protein